MNYVAMLQSVETTFTTTVLSAQSLSAQSVEKNWTVFATLGGFALFLSAALLMGLSLDWLEEDKDEDHAIQRQSLRTLSVRELASLFDGVKRKRPVAVEEQQ